MKATFSAVALSRPARIRKVAGFGIATALMLITRGSIFAADVVSDWANAVSGQWNVTTNWINTPASGSFPNNGNGGISTYDALIDATGDAYTVTSSTDVVVEDLLLNSANATLHQTDGVFRATGAINILAGEYRLGYGEISNTAINVNGGRFIVDYVDQSHVESRLTNGTVLNGDLNLGKGFLRLQSGARFTGSANFTGYAAVLSIEDTRTITGQTLNLDSRGFVTVTGANTLTLGAGTLLRGWGELGSYFAVEEENNHVVNQAGTIRADYRGEELGISGKTFTNQAGARLEAINGSTLTITSTSWSNAGQISATGGSTLKFFGSWSNAGGTVTIDGTSTLTLSGLMTTAGLGTINNTAGGTVNLNGTVDNTGATLSFDDRSGSYHLAGVIYGGQINPGSGKLTISHGFFRDGAVFNGDLNLPAGTLVRLESGSSFIGAANVSGVLGLGSVTVTDNTINLERTGATLDVLQGHTATLGPGTLLRGFGKVTSLVGGGKLRNEGTIRADVPGQRLFFDNDLGDLINQGGVIEARNGGTLHLDDGFVQTSGTTRVADNSAITLRSDPLDIQGGRIEGTGTISGIVVNGATIAPGLPVGRLNIAGDLILRPSSVIQLEVGGLAQGTQFDLLQEGGTLALSLAGTLSVTLFDGFIPSSTNSFAVVSSNQVITGEFENVVNGARLATADGSGSFQVNYGMGSSFGGNQVVLSNFAIPEPSTAGLLASAGTWLALGRRGARGVRKARRE